jgi:predicted GNAT family N-acyltransferase
MILTQENRKIQFYNAIIKSLHHYIYAIILNKKTMEIMHMHFEFYKDVPIEARNIRQKVFVEEQGFKHEFDAIDNTATHLLVFENNVAIATARFFNGKTKKEFIIGRIAVLPKYRNKHIGAEMLEILQKKINELGGDIIILSAQCRVQPFYEKQGYKAQGQTYLEDFCKHIKMVKTL